MLRQSSAVGPEVCLPSKDKFSYKITTVSDMSKVVRLTADDEAETREYLSQRPVQTLVMASFIEDNGLVSVLNRGEFFGYRSENGTLDGVALIGHTTLIDSASEEALKAFAFQARSSKTPIHLIMANGEDAERFYGYLTSGRSAARLRCEENVFEAAFPFVVQSSKLEVTTASIAHLDEIAEAQAEIAFLESGVDPMERDPEGFRERVARRIGMGRVFTATIDGKMVFKADVMAIANNSAYLEGVYVAPEFRGKGIGSGCLATLTRKLLGTVDNVCLMSNVDHSQAQRSYLKAGFRQTSRAVSLFVKRENA